MKTRAIDEQLFVRRHFRLETNNKFVGILRSKEISPKMKRQFYKNSPIENTD
jgi:hypothetical protein